MRSIIFRRMIFVVVLAWAAFTVLGSTPVIAQDDIQAVRQKVEQGDAAAQYNLGLRYANGQGMKQDYVQARQWFQKAAAQGLSEAQYNLGVMYDNGLGVRQDYAKACQWYQKAAEQGLAEAQAALGMMYHEGQWVKQDYAKARLWLQKAAEQGFAKAQYNLGVMYDQGQGVKQDDAQARQWYQKAAEQGFASAQLNLGVMYYEGQGVKRDYTQARQWYQKAAEQGNARAKENLNKMQVTAGGGSQGAKTDISDVLAKRIRSAPDAVSLKCVGSHDTAFITISERLNAVADMNPILGSWTPWVNGQETELCCGPAKVEFNDDSIKWSMNTVLGYIENSLDRTTLIMTTRLPLVGEVFSCHKISRRKQL